MFLVVWKYAQMHQNTFLTTPDVQNIFFEKKCLVVWKYAKMHQNRYLTSPDVKKYLFWGHDFGGLEVSENATKHGFNHSRRSKIRFGGTMPLFLKLYYFLPFIHTIQSHFVHPSPFAEARLLESSSRLRSAREAGSASHGGWRSKISFLKKSFWWSRSMRKWIKTRFLPLQTFKNIFFEKKVSGGLEVCANASKHAFTTPDVKKYLF